MLKYCTIHIEYEVPKEIAQKGPNRVNNWWQLERHSSCPELCLNYALDQCTVEHTHYSPDVDGFYNIRKDLKQALEKIADPEKTFLS